MLDFEEKKKLKEIIYSRISLIVIIILCLLTGKGVWSAFWDSYNTRENKINAENELKELKDRKENILSEINKLNTSDGVEREIRDKFRVAKEGEQMVIILDSEQNNTGDEIKKSLWEKITDFFN